MRKITENGAAWACLVGMMGSILAGMIFMFAGIDNLVTNILTAVFVAILGYGCFAMIHFIWRKIPLQKLEKWTVAGAFGLVALMCTEHVVDFLVSLIFWIILPPITVWYAIPCFLLFFGGLLIIAFKGIREERQMRKGKI